MQNVNWVVILGAILSASYCGNYQRKLRAEAHEMIKQELLTSGKTPTEVARIIEAAVEAINHGAIDSLDSLISIN